MSMNSNNFMLLAAASCGRIPGIFDIVEKHSFAVFGTMDEKSLKCSSLSTNTPVYFYETGWIIPRRVVAVGNLDKVWVADPECAAAEELQDAFQSHFDARWAEVLDVAEKSFTYNSFNEAYFSVRNLRPVENLTLEKLLEKTGIGQPPNIIVS